MRRSGSSGRGEGKRRHRNKRREQRRKMIGKTNRSSCFPYKKILLFSTFRGSGPGYLKETPWAYNILEKRHHRTELTPRVPRVSRIKRVLFMGIMEGVNN